MQEIVQKSSFVGEFVKYYELFFYLDKDDLVRKTIDFIRNCSDKYVKNDMSLGGENDIPSLLDVGCGTGIYEDGLVNIFDEVVAVDLSDDMIKFAREHHSHDNCDYQVVDICNNNPFDQRFDMVISLSHVIGYQTDNDLLRGFFSGISRSLKPGGIFLFNFYNEPGILCGDLKPKSSSVDTQYATISRESTATPVYMKNSIELDYRYSIHDKSEDEDIMIKIREKIRYFSVLELEEYLYSNDMEILEVTGFLSDAPLTEKEWNGCVIARKTGHGSVRE